MCIRWLSPGNASGMPAEVAQPAKGREPAGHEGSAGGHGWGSAPTPLRGAPPLLCKGINFPVTLGRVQPLLCHLPHGAPWPLCPTCLPAQPQPRCAAGSQGSQALPGAPSPPALPHLYLDNFFTHFIYEDSPPSANTLSFLLLWSGRLVSLFYSYCFSLSPLQGPRLGSPAPREARGRPVPAGARLCLATGADGESGCRWDVQRFFPSCPAAPGSACACLGR